MDRRALIDQLPTGLAVAVRLHEAGYPDGVIAVGLGIPVESVPSTITVATSKLAHLAGRRDRTRTPASASDEPVGGGCHSVHDQQ